MMKMRFMTSSIARHCVCANCGEMQIEASSGENGIIEVDVLGSASVNDRLKAMDMLAKYGLGTSNEEKVEVRDGDNLPTAEERKARVLSLVKRA